MGFFDSISHAFSSAVSTVSHGLDDASSFVSHKIIKHIPLIGKPMSAVIDEGTKLGDAAVSTVEKGVGIVSGIAGGVVSTGTSLAKDQQAILKTAGATAVGLTKTASKIAPQILKKTGQTITGLEGDVQSVGKAVGTLASDAPGIIKQGVNDVGSVVGDVGKGVSGLAGLTGDLPLMLMAGGGIALIMLLRK